MPISCPTRQFQLFRATIGQGGISDGRVGNPLAETYLGIVEHYKLGEIADSATAGHEWELPFGLLLRMFLDRYFARQAREK
jgi:hypothetical protein